MPVITENEWQALAHAVQREVVSHFPDWTGTMHIQLDLYANVRPAKSRLGVGLTGKPVDMVIYRENTEGFYADRNMSVGIGEFMPHRVR